MLLKIRYCFLSNDYIVDRFEAYIYHRSGQLEI